MVKRMVLVLSVTAVLLTALGFVKYRQVETAVHASSSFQPPPEAVTSIVAKRELWPATMSIIGTMGAVQGGGQPYCSAASAQSDLCGLRCAAASGEPSARGAHFACDIGGYRRTDLQRARQRAGFDRG